MYCKLFFPVFFFFFVGLYFFFFSLPSHLYMT